MSGRFRRDERGVSEVLGYLLGFFMSFLLLMFAVFAFQLLADRANENAAHVHFKDLSNRVAASVLRGVDIANQRVGGDSSAASAEVHFLDRITIPTNVRGFSYRVTLEDDPDQVHIVSQRGEIEESAGLFNLKVPAPADCRPTEPVCSIGGTVASDQGFVLVKYEFKSTGASITCATIPVNCITIG